jgi:FkbM family methyltransferase
MNGSVIHAGAYFGDFLPGIAKGCFPGSKVWAFEPNLENFRCAKITVELNELPNVELYSVGLGETRCEGSLLVSGANGQSLGGGCRVIKEPDAARVSTATIQLVPADEIIPIERKISVIHLDIEGYEKHALAGALGIIRFWKPLLILETLPNEKWLADNLFGLGYRIEEKVNENTVLRARPIRDS